MGEVVKRIPWPSPNGSFGRCHQNRGTKPIAPLPAVRDNSAMEADPPVAATPKRKRRWFQFSLRTLMISSR